MLANVGGRYNSCRCLLLCCVSLLSHPVHHRLAGLNSASGTLCCSHGSTEALNIVCDLTLQSM